MLPSLNLRFFVFALLSILLVDKIGAQEADLGEINIPNPSSYIENYEYDAACLLYTYPSPRDKRQSRMPSSA